MKNIVFYLKIIILILIVLSSINVSTFYSDEERIELCFNEDDSLILVEKNIVSKDIISLLYKDSDGSFVGKFFDYNTNKELEIKDLIKEEKLGQYQNKITELLYLKYPKFVVEALLQENVTNSYLFRDNELVIYYSNYEVEPRVEEVLYLTVNYNEIKDYINFTVLLESDYENESGYDYTNSKKSIAITFDDSPNNNKTNKILSYLEDNHFHATFFVVGNKAIYNKDLLISIKNSGNEIGSHSYDHKNMSKMTNEEFILDFNKVNDYYKSLFNEDLMYTRPPYGLIKDSQLSLVDTTYIMWSLDTLDWKKRNSNYLVNYVLDNVKDGDIILFHDSYNSTVKAIEELLPLLYSKGYQVMSVSELFKIKGIEIENNKIYHNAY